MYTLSKLMPHKNSVFIELESDELIGLIHHASMNLSIFFRPVISVYLYTFI